MAQAYFATRISENLAKTGEGYLLSTGTCVGRSGFQRYGVRELPQDRAAELGLDVSDWGKSVDVFRPVEEVFAPSTVASGNGKPICDGHPSGFVDTHNFNELTRGHMMNLRKGPEALESGDWPLLADLLFTNAEIIDKIENHKARQLSLGYEYELNRDGDLLTQNSIVINHCALVDQARAGPEARINDAASDVEAPVAEQDQQHPVAESTNLNKGAVKVKITDKLKHVFGLGLKQAATDSSPEELADLASEYNRVVGRGRDSDDEPDEEKKKKEAEDRKRADDMKSAEDKAMKDAADKKAKDEAEEAEAKAKKEAEDAMEDVHRIAAKVGDHRCKDCMGADAKCHDCMMHDRLDDVLEAKKEATGDGMEDLKDMVGNHMGEESQDDMPSDIDGEGSQVIEPVGEDTNMANDAATALLPLIEKSPDKRMLQRAFDAAPLDASFEFLKAMRPAAAKTTDKKFRRAFDAEVRKFTRTSRPGQAGGYEVVGAAARARDAARITNGERSANGNGPKIVDNSKIQALYDAARTGKPIVKS